MATAETKTVNPAELRAALSNHPGASDGQLAKVLKTSRQAVTAARKRLELVGEPAPAQKVANALTERPADEPPTSVQVIGSAHDPLAPSGPTEAEVRQAASQMSQELGTSPDEADALANNATEKTKELRADARVQYHERFVVVVKFADRVEEATQVSDVLSAKRAAAGALAKVGVLSATVYDRGEDGDGFDPVHTCERRARRVILLHTTQGGELVFSASPSGRAKALATQYKLEGQGKFRDRKVVEATPEHLAKLAKEQADAAAERKAQRAETPS